MNCELHVIRKIIDSDDPDKRFFEVMDQIKTDKVFLAHGQEFNTLLTHRSAYGKLPNKEAFEKLNKGVILPEAPEPMAYYLDDMNKSFIYFHMAEINSGTVKLLGEDKPIEAMNFSSQQLNLLTQSTPSSADTDLTQTVDARVKRYIEKRKIGIISGVPSGWTRLDEETTGWQKAELTFLIGRMGSFKTWVLISWAIYAWLKGYSPLFFSREMGEKQISRRIDTMIASTRFRDVKTGVITDEDFNSFTAGLSSIFKGKHPFRIVDSAHDGKFDADFIQRKIREYRPDIVFGDGAYLLLGEGDTDWERQTSVSRSLKQISLTEDISQIWTSQANRGAAGKNQKIKLQNIAYSDSYGQDADNVISLNRMWDEQIDNYSNDLLVEVLKTRDGENIKIPVQVDLNSMQILESLNQMQQDKIFMDEGEDTLMI